MTDQNLRFENSNSCALTLGPAATGGGQAGSGFAGMAIGSAMMGLRPIVEFMSWSFSLVAADPILNNAPKMLYMSGGQFNIPIVFRGPGGAAHQLAAQHSQSLEAWYASVPGMQKKHDDWKGFQLD